MNSKHSEKKRQESVWELLKHNCAEKNKLLMEKYFYITVIAILGTGVWSPTQGRTGGGRSRRGEDEVSLATAPWDNHRNKGGDQVESLEPTATPPVPSAGTESYRDDDTISLCDNVHYSMPPVARARKGWCVEPWVVGLITFLSLIVLAVCIGLTVHYVRYNQRKTYNYYSILPFTSDKLYNEFGREASKNFTEMSQRIESMVKNAFYQSPLRGELIKSHIIKFSQESNGVLAHMLLIFRFPSTEDPETINNIIDNVLHEKLQNAVGPPNVDPESVEIKKINKTEIDHYLNNCCGTRRNKSSTESLRIVGGTEVEEGEWPWQASLQWDGTHRCGATLINSTWLVSAAHCFRMYKDPSRWTASFGVTIQPPKMKKGLRRIIVHEKYKYPSHEYDISLAELSSPVHYTNAVHRICLPDATHEFHPGDEMFVTGFGVLQTDGYTQNHLRQVQVNLIDSKICNKPQVYNGVITSTMLCAGSLKGKRDACQGDSGGPLVSSDARDIWYLAGIVSWGDECGQPNKPGVYTRVTAFRDWIASKTGI
ncbi:transmembrane protease serine 11E-like [Callospermophilus lateralis]|uniref:transmembrane protease serine 11E-like n=1 Tax=Callospermophilus lateralis TaxID=76772 RepID=UPI004053E052